jgi:superfamily II DNA or RNA helicase
MLNPAIGSVVTCRDRQWVVLPSENPDVIRLRPLSGNEDEVCGIFRKLELEAIASAEFPPPQPEAIQNHEAALLLMDAARLSLRNGAGPFRSLGRLSVYPRPYQMVPLLMALRLETVRLLIADDVGIGKTIEAGLIAREMLDRGEVRRLAVLCPPHLCDQWQRELREKFHIEAVVIRSGTVGKLERSLPTGDRHVFGYYPHIIVSLDYAKSDKRRASFLAHCPDLVIVDEAHTCACPSGQSTSQQQRHQLVHAIAEKPDRHLILLTATPHSGIEESFLSTLGLIKPEFATMDLEHLSEQQRIKLAGHFIQRRRADVKSWLGSETPFPERLSTELDYKLTREYRTLFEEVYGFARGLVKGVTEQMSYAQKRGRYWAALALIRCVMSSPAAAVATLSKQVENRELNASNAEADEPIDEDLMATYIYDPTEQEHSADAQPTLAIEQGQKQYLDSDRRKLKEFVREAAKLYGDKDAKLQQAIATVNALLKEGHHPIVWCRYIATAKYVADALKQKLDKKSVRVLAITGENSEDEREAFLSELAQYPQRVLVATDCLSEGVNLQEHFSAVLHYDLPWNPNRLEQREGRVDRYGQKSSEVKCAILCGRDNPIDDVVLKVLIRKAVNIHRSLGITVPVPMDSANVTEKIFKSLFEYSSVGVQLSLFETGSQLSLLDAEMNLVWAQAEEREKLSRTRFAQRLIKPEDVEQELIESDRVLGSAKEIERFVKTACSRLNATLIPKTIQKHPCWLLPHIPPNLLPALSASLGDVQKLTLSFVSPTPEGVEFIGRNHPLVEGLARYLLEDVLSNTNSPIAARCGLTITDAVTKRTTLLLLRLRHLLDSAQHQSLLAEECLVVGFTGAPSNPIWLDPSEALQLIEAAEPVADPPSLGIARSEIRDLLEGMEDLTDELKRIAKQRSHELAQSHRRVRAITKEGQVKVKAQLPMDFLGVYVLQPGQRRTVK